MASHFDLTDMQLLVNVASAMSLTKAAEHTFLSLPAASNRVKNLEGYLGTPLLYRNSQGVTLTPAGEAFVRHARIVLHQLQHLRGDIQEYAQGVKGRVRVYANTTAMNEFVPAVLERYLVSHPSVNIELRERLSYQVVKAVVEGAADIGITAQGSGGAGVKFLPYRTDRLVLVTHRDHPLARKQGPHSFGNVLDYDFISLAESSAIHSFLLTAAEDSGRFLRVRVEVGNFETACRLIGAQVGIGVIPETAARRYVQLLPLKIMDLTDEWALRQLHICVRESTELPAFSQELVDLLVQDAERTVGTDGSDLKLV
ncbi:MAG: LysR family transcriptional regulator [Castellaniella sp.]|uniref:LysR substrate-binding domain-containing protein n=1 Tax=Castellaniella sp. TaxID=1955812 RepID=UPI00121D61B9|nr:LysR substrate-binding domain-containing protein [Castellaniella sp.]TAN30891.1 MAG: LysR family transcriptional regulator [Castellaniella sp.]